MGRPNGQQAQFADFPILGQVGVDVAQLLVEGKRPVAPQGDHAHDPVLVDGDDVEVLVVEAIDVPALGVGLVLRDFLDEGLVSQLEDLLELPKLVRDLEPDWARVSHDGPRL